MSWFALENDEAGGGTGGRPPTQPPSGSGSQLPAILFGMLRRHWLVAALVGPAIAVLGVLAVDGRFKPSYRAEATLYVQPALPSLVYTDERWRADSTVGYYNDFLRTLCQIGREPVVLNEALRRLDEAGVDWRPEAISAEEAFEHLRARIAISVIRETHLLSISFDDGNPEVVAPVVNAVANALVAEIDHIGRRRNSERLEKLKGERGRATQALEEARKGLIELYPVLGAALVDARHNVPFERVKALQQVEAGAQRGRLEAAADLAEAEATAEQLRTLLPSGEIEALVDADPSLEDGRTMLARMAREIESETGDLTGDHPLRQQALLRLEEATGRLKALEERTRARITDRVRRQREERAGELLFIARRRHEGAVRSADGLSDRVEEAREDLATYARLLLDGQQRKRECQNLLDAVDRIDKRIEQVLVESRAGARVTERALGFDPSKPDKDRRKLMKIVAVIVGMGAGVAAAVAWGLLLAWRRRR